LDDARRTLLDTDENVHEVMAKYRGIDGWDLDPAGFPT
jgi:hypothetical protein